MELLVRHRVEPRVLARSVSILNNLVLMEAAGALSVFPAAVGREYERRGLLATLPLALPPVFGPRSLSSRRLWSWLEAIGKAWLPSLITM